MTTALLAAATIVGLSPLVATAATYTPNSTTSTPAFPAGFTAGSRTVTGTTCGAFTPMTNLFAQAGMSGVVGYQKGAGTSASALPGVWRNPTNATLAIPGNPLPAQTTALHPGTTDCAVLRFTVPNTGQYSVDARFGVVPNSQSHIPGVGHPAQVLAMVLQGDKQLAAGTVENKPGSTNTQVTYRPAPCQPLKAGDSLDFAVHPGTDFLSDTTLLDVTITSCDPPPVDVPVVSASCAGNEGASIDLSTKATNPGWAAKFNGGPYASIASTPGWTAAEYPTPDSSWGLNPGLAEWATFTKTGSATEKPGDYYYRIRFEFKKCAGNFTVNGSAFRGDNNVKLYLDSENSAGLLSQCADIFCHNHPTHLTPVPFASDPQVCQGVHDLFVKLNNASNDPSGVLVNAIASCKAQVVVAPADRDKDGVPDVNDNCPDKANPSQLDSDQDGLGDECDPTPTGITTTTAASGSGTATGGGVSVGAPDQDRDGVDDKKDNCPGVANPNQADTDGDGVGDACDPTPNGNGTGTNGGPTDTSVLQVVCGKKPLILDLSTLPGSKWEGSTNLTSGPYSPVFFPAKNAAWQAPIGAAWATRVAGGASLDPFVGTSYYRIQFQFAKNCKGKFKVSGKFLRGDNQVTAFLDIAPFAKCTNAGGFCFANGTNQVPSGTYSSTTKPCTGLHQVIVHLKNNELSAGLALNAILKGCTI